VQHIQKPEKNNQKHTWKEKLKWKSNTLLKKEKRNVKKYIKNGIVTTKKSEKNFKNTGYENQEIKK
jgi:hypothetical protein